jgi:glycine oxidase
MPGAPSAAAGADVVVVGAGVIGCAVALRLAQAGADVLVLERALPGQEASWAAGGILGAQMEAHGQGPMLDLSLASRRMFPALAEELKSSTGIDVRYRPSGVLELAFDEPSEHALLDQHAWQEPSGLRASLVSATNLFKRKAFGAPRLGLWLPDDGQVDNQLLTSALQIAASKAGARFRSGAQVRRLLAGVGLEPRCSGVELYDGAAYAKNVVLAAGSWTGMIEGVPLPLGAIVPVRGQMVALRPAAPLFSEVLTGAGGYAVPRVDGRVLVGSTVERVGFDKAVTAAGLRALLDRAQTLVPALADARVEDHWSGLRPGTADGLPILGKSALDGLLFATGHYRSGVLLAPATADAIRDLVMNRASRFELKPFSAERFSHAPQS